MPTDNKDAYTPRLKLTPLQGKMMISALALLLLTLGTATGLALTGQSQDLYSSASCDAGQLDITNACNPACCNANSQCPNNQTCTLINGYCQSGTSCDPYSGTDPVTPPPLDCESGKINQNNQCDPACCDSNSQCTVSGETCSKANGHCKSGTSCGKATSSGSGGTTPPSTGGGTGGSTGTTPGSGGTDTSTSTSKPTVSITVSSASTTAKGNTVTIKVSQTNAAHCTIHTPEGDVDYPTPASTFSLASHPLDRGVKYSVTCTNKFGTASATASTLDELPHCGELGSNANDHAEGSVMCVWPINAGDDIIDYRCPLGFIYSASPTPICKDVAEIPKCSSLGGQGYPETPGIMECFNNIDSTAFSYHCPAGLAYQDTLQGFGSCEDPAGIPDCSSFGGQAWPNTPYATKCTTGDLIVYHCPVRHVHKLSNNTCFPSIPPFNSQDYGALFKFWGQVVTALNAHADFNGDGVIGPLDYVILFDNWAL